MNKNQKIIMFSAFGLLVILVVTALYFYFVRRSPILLPGGVQTPVPVPTFTGEKPAGVTQSDFADLKFDASSDDIISKLGQPKNIREEDGKTVFEYSSEYPDFPNEVLLVNDQFAVSKEIITPKDSRFNKKLSDYTNTVSPLSRIDPEYGDAYYLYIYEDQGFALLAHIIESVVFEVWNFEPTSIENILNTWGNDLLTQEEFDKQRNESGHY